MIASVAPVVASAAASEWIEVPACAMTVRGPSSPWPASRSSGRRAKRENTWARSASSSATDACSAVCDEAVQIHGGYGYMREYLVERLYRDARLYPIGGGTREIMNEIISKTEGY